tara:strand:+ start:437 stop:595 length:159 start_codon:yes stop_codon:yes gene_type:complete
LKNQTRQIIKNVIEENAVAFKDNASKLIYSKVGKKLQDQYKTVAQNLMRPNQ